MIDLPKEATSGVFCSLVIVWSCYREIALLLSYSFFLLIFEWLFVMNFMMYHCYDSYPVDTKNT